MTYHKRIFVLFIRALPLLALLSCRPVVDLERPEDYGYFATVNNIFTNAFVSFWTGMNVNYVFWDLEPLDYWDKVWDTYKPKFDALSAGNYTSEVQWNEALTQSYQYFKEMTSPLIDGHLVITFNHSDQFPSISPTELRADKRYTSLADNKNPKRAFWSNWSGTPYAKEPAFVHYNFMQNTIAGYIDDSLKTFSTPADSTQHPAAGFRAAIGRIPASSGGFMLYFYFSSFELSQYAADQSFADMLNQCARDIMAPDLKGVIFDLRGNIGGANMDIDLVLNRFIHKPLLFAYTRYKNGPNRQDYKPWMPYYINPHPYPWERVKHDVPMVALINDYSISCAEMLPLAIKAMPKGYLIGTRTYGATGPRVGHTFPAATNGGPFSNNSGNTIWNNVIQAGLQLKDHKGVIYEGVGILPDKELTFDWAEFYGDGNGSGRDRQLEAAIAYIDG